MNGASLIAIHEGRYYKRPDGLSLGPGAFVKGLEYATNTKAEVIGKPTAEFFRAALEDIPPEEAIMIGDVIKYSLIYIHVAYNFCWILVFYFFAVET